MITPPVIARLILVLTYSANFIPNKLQQGVHLLEVLFWFVESYAIKLSLVLEKLIFGEFPLGVTRKLKLNVFPHLIQPVLVRVNDGGGVYVLEYLGI